MSIGDEILAKADATFLSLIRNSAVGLVRSGVLSDDPLADAQAMDALAMEEPAVAFDYDMPDAGTGETRKITRADIEELVIAISQRYPLLLPEKVAEIKASLLMNIGVSKSNFSEIEVQAMNMARAASAERSEAQQPMTPEQKVEQLFNDLDKLDKDQREKAKDVVGKYANEAQQKKLAELEKAVDEAKEERGPKLAEAYKALFAYRAELYPELREKALRDGDMESVRIMDELMKDAKGGVGKAEQVNKIMAKVAERKKVEEPTAGFDWGTPNQAGNDDYASQKKDVLGFTEDDWSKAFASADQGKQVTMEDVAVPSGGQKSRSTNKSLT